MSGDKIRKLWKAYQKETPILRIPFRKDIINDGSEATRHAYVILLPYHEDDDAILNGMGTPFDYVATILAFDRSLTPIQYRPLFISEKELFINNVFFTKEKAGINAFVNRIRSNLKEGSLKEEKSLLPFFDRLDMQVLESSENLVRGTPDIFGVDSVKRFVSRLNYNQSDSLLAERVRYQPRNSLSTQSSGMIMSYDKTLDHMDFLDKCELEETKRFLNAFKGWEVDWELAGKLKNVSGSSPYSYGYFNGNYKNAIILPNGQLKEIYPRKEAMESYPLFGNEIANNVVLRNAIDQGKALAPVLLKEIDVNTGHDVIIGKRLLKTISGEDIIPPKGWSAYDYMTMLAVVPDSMTPETYEEQEAMEFCMEVIFMLEKATGNSIMSMVKGAKCGWVNFKKKMVAATVNHRLPLGMTEEFHDWLMERLPVDEWKIEENADIVRYNIIEFVNSISPHIPAALMTDHLSVWLSSVYAPYDSIDFMRDFIMGMEDVINLFESKVTSPLSVHLAGEQDHILTNEISISSIKAARDILFMRNRSAVDLLSLIRSVHAEMNEIKAHGIDGLRRQVGDVHVNEFDYQEGGIRRIFRTIIRNKERHLLGLEEDMSWVPLVPTTSIAPNGFRIVPLVTMGDLKQESEYMQHCVGRSRHYEQSCISGKSNIYTVLNDDNVRKTTLEIILDHEKRTVRIAQNQAFRNYNNGSPEIRYARDAVKWFVKSINEGKLEVEWPYIKEFKKAMVKNNHGQNAIVVPLTINEMAEYNSSSTSAVSDALLPWRKYLDKSLRKATIKDFEKFPAIRETITLINPYYGNDMKISNNKGNFVKNSPKPAWQM